jgi:Fur family ferric uptake transcriptional regulator
VTGLPREQFEQRLRERGMRVTTQRFQIYSAVNRLEHATPEHILREVDAESPGLTLSTVYRALEALEEAGLVTHTHLGHAPMTYHVVDEHAHIHLVCESCGTVVSAPADLTDSLRALVSREFSFDIDPTHMAMAGRCAQCRESR